MSRMLNFSGHYQQRGKTKFISIFNLTKVKFCGWLEEHGYICDDHTWRTKIAHILWPDESLIAIPCAE